MPSKDINERWHQHVVTDLYDSLASVVEEKDTSWDTVAKNFVYDDPSKRGPGGELDIMLRDEDTNNLHYIEVKTGKTSGYQQQIKRAEEHFDEWNVTASLYNRTTDLAELETALPEELDERSWDLLHDLKQEHGAFVAPNGMGRYANERNRALTRIIGAGALKRVKHLKVDYPTIMETGVDAEVLEGDDRYDEQLLMDRGFLEERDESYQPTSRLRYVSKQVYVISPAAQAELGEYGTVSP